MTRKLEIAIGVTLIIVAVLFLFTGVYGIYKTLELRDQLIAEIGPEMRSNFSNAKLFKQFHLLFLLEILQLFGGLLLILEKKGGWVLSVLSGIAGSIYLGHSMYTILNLYESHVIYTEGMGTMIWIAYLIWMIYMFIGLILTTKWFREKYRPSANTVVSIALAIIIMTIDLFFVIQSR